MALNGVGLWTASLDGVPAREVQQVAAELDSQGWSSLWFGEAYGREAFTAAAVVLWASQRLQVGAEIAHIYSRDAIVCAAAARTLHAAHRGRFVLGISHVPLLERLRGHVHGSPIEEMTSYLDGLAAAPSGVAGEKELPPIMLSALGPLMIDLGRERTQGVAPYLVLPEHTATTRERLGADRRLVVEQAAVVTPGIDADEWRRRAQEHLESYTSLPNFRASLLRQGFNNSDLVPGGSERLKRAMVPFGVDATRQRIEDHRAAGADEVLVQVLGEHVLTPPRAEWALLAREL